MRKLKDRLKVLNRTVYKPDSDPQFYLFLNRLADAEEFKKTDRIDGRRALDEFISEQNALIRCKKVKIAEQVKLEFEEQMR